MTALAALTKARHPGLPSLAQVWRGLLQPQIATPPARSPHPAPKVERKWDAPDHWIQRDR